MHTTNNQDFSHVFLDDGLPIETTKKRYKKRRQSLTNKLKNLTIIYGINESPSDKYLWDMSKHIICQETLLLYLTGLNQVKTALILDPNNKNEPEILFLAKCNENHEFWEGKRISIGNKNSIKTAAYITGFKDIRDIETLNEVILEKLRKTGSKQISTYWHETTKGKKKVTKDSNFIFKNRLSRLLKNNGFTSTKINNISETAWKIRPEVDAEDKKNLLVANEKTANLFRDLFDNWSKLKSETEVAGFIDGQIAVATSFGNSFPTITASGKNATTLHYRKNDQPLKESDLLLIDCGLRWHTMCTDVSRTIPISGKFNALQKLLYKIVLTAQKKVEAAVRPGITILDLDKICWDFINNEIQEKVISKGGKFTKAYKEQPHKVGHLVGIQVHDGDPYGEYRSCPLKAGIVITNEPGIYGKFEIQIDGISYQEEIGIRIEDNLLVTDTGCINLSSAIPKEIDEIETAIAKCKWNL
jgi:Xaa-Pro aminopeptidase